ncbi:MAG: hypothetical protein SLRJCFUN_001101 [Candidatus Fervidibacter sp.]
MPKVSVIVPTYCPQEFLRFALASVKDQKGVDLEILLVDDSSPKEFRKILETLALSHGAYLILREQRGGPAAAHNTGIRYSRGEFIAFLEHDDLFLPNKLPIQVALMEEHPDWGMSYVGAYLLDKQGKMLRALPLASWSGREALLRLLDGNFIPSMSSVVVRRTCLEEVGCLDEGFQIAHDYDLWLRIATSQWQIGNVPYRLVGIRRHDSNWSAQNQRRGIEETLQTLEKVCSRHPHLWRWSRRHQARCWYRLGRFHARHGDWASAQICYQQAFALDPMLWKAGLRWLQAKIRRGAT